MRLLYVYDGGANCRYWEAMMPRMAELFPAFQYTIISGLHNYLTANQDGFDFIVYQTFPDEKHPWKYKAALVQQTDRKFLQFPGIKILLDSLDGSVANGLPRFGNQFPRIKHVAGKEYCDQFEVLLNILPEVFTPLSDDAVKTNRHILIHCAFNVEGYPHHIRPEVMKVLHKAFEQETNFNRIPKRDYRTFLCDVSVTVTAPGYGYTSTTFFHAMNAGSCVFAHEMVNRLGMFPHVDLVDGEDYVSFNLDNMSVRLRELINNPIRRKAIAESGRKKFLVGIDIDKSCKEFYAKLGELLGHHGIGNIG